jgi:hypothetical protein
LEHIEPPRRSFTLAFALALCLGAHFLYLGDIGKWREDFTWTLRDPVTGLNDWAGLFRFPFFWRPCSLVYVRGLNTLFWNFDPPRQALAVLAHLFTAWMLLRAMRAWGASPRIAGTGALLFLVLPQTYEVALWPSATPTAIATGIFLLLVAWAPRLAKARPLAIAGFVALGAVIPCWNEQPAAGLAALPLLLLADRGEPRRLTRAVLITGAVGLACVAYLALYLVTSPHGGRGAIGSYTPPDELANKVLIILRDAADKLVGTSAYGMLRGGLRLGAPVLETTRGVLWLLFATLAGLAWAFRSRYPTAHIGPRPPWQAILFGVLAAAAMLVPMVVITLVRVEPRMLYAPAACLIFAGTCAVTALLRRPALALAGPRWINVAFAAPFSLALIVFGTALTGYQTMLRTRSRMDWAEIKLIAQLIPNPPPETLFLMVKDATSAAGTHFHAFDRAEFGAWSRDAYGCALLRLTYSRTDLYSKRFLPGPQIAIGEDGITTSVWLRVGYSRGISETRFFPWDHVFLLAIEPDGRIHTVPRSTLTASRNPSAASSPGSPPPPGLP